MNEQEMTDAEVEARMEPWFLAEIDSARYDPEAARCLKSNGLPVPPPRARPRHIKMVDTPHG